MSSSPSSAIISTPKTIITNLTPLLTTTALLSLSLTQYTIHSSLLSLISPNNTSTSSSDSSAKYSPRLISRLWRQTYPVTIGADVLLSLTGFVGAIRLLRARNLQRQGGGRDGIWLSAMLGTILMGTRLVSSWVIGRLAVDMAGAYERVGIWRKGNSGDQETGVQMEEKETEEVMAMEEGRNVGERVDERVLEMERRWVRWCGLRGLGVDLMGMGVYGWMAVKGT